MARTREQSSRRRDRRDQAVGFGVRFVAPLFMGVMLNPINSTMIAVALIPIGRSYGAGTATTVWLVAALYLACAIAQPVMGKLADRLGARRVFLGGVVLVGIAGLGGALVPSLAALVGIRVLIGIGTSAAYPAAMAMVRSQSQRLEQNTPGGVLGALSLSGLISAGVGPPLGGALIALFGWRSIFLVNLPLAAITIALSVLWLPGDEHSAHQETRRLAQELDPLGVVMFGAAVTVLLLFLMELRTPHWVLLGSAAALAALLAGWELRARRPFLDLRMLAANRPLVLTYARYVLTFLVIYGVLYGLPQWLEHARRMSPIDAGLVLLPMFLVAAVCNQLGARDRRVRGPLLLGTAAMVAGSLALTAVSSQTAILIVIGVGALFGISNGLNVVANQTALYDQAPEDQIGTASGLFRTAQYVGSIFSAGVIGIAYGARASDHGLTVLAIVFCVLSVALLIETVADRTLTGPRRAREDRRQRPSSPRRQPIPARTER